MSQYLHAFLIKSFFSEVTAYKNRAVCGYPISVITSGLLIVIVFNY